MSGNLSGAVAWYSAGNLFVRAATFLLLPLYSNLISPADFGIFSIIMAFYAVSSVLFQGGLQSALSKYYIEREEKTEIFSVVMNIVLVWGAILLFAVFIFSPFFSSLFFGTPVYSSYFRLITISLYIETLIFFILHLFKTKEQASKAVIYTLAGALINIILNIIFVYVYREGIWGILKAQLYSSIVTLVILLPYAKENYKPTLQNFFHTSFFRPLFFFSLPVFLSGLFSSLVDVADRFILNDILGVEKTGIYSFAYRFAMVMNIFVISFRTAFTPFAINLYSSGDYRERLGGILNNLVASGALIILTFSFLADDLFDLNLFGINFFQGNYESGIVILPFVLTGYFFSALMSFYSVYPFVSGRSFHFLFADALSLIVNLTMNFMLIPIAGLMGAGLATLFAFLTGAVYLYTISAQKIVIDYNKKVLLQLVLAGIVILLIGMYLDNIFSDLTLLFVYLVVLKLNGVLRLSIFRFKPL
jgi:O-antigen/teichoic acid export membrane protein